MTALDLQLFYWLNQSWPDAALWRWLSLSADSFMVVALVLILIALRAFTPALSLALAGLIVGLAVSLIKEYTAVLRPAAVLDLSLLHWQLPLLLQDAFPSGHSATAAVVVAALWRWLKHWRWPLALWALLVGWSRISLGAHWPSDVVAGLALAAVIGSTVAWLLSRRPPPGLRAIALWWAVISCVALPLAARQQVAWFWVLLPLSLFALFQLWRYRAATHQRPQPDNAP